MTERLVCKECHDGYYYWPPLVGECRGGEYRRKNFCPRCDRLDSGESDNLCTVKDMLEISS